MEPINIEIAYFVVGTVLAVIAGGITAVYQGVFTDWNSFEEVFEWGWIVFSIAAGAGMFGPAILMVAAMLLPFVLVSVLIWATAKGIKSLIY